MLSGFQTLNFGQSLLNSISNSKCGLDRRDPYSTNTLGYSGDSRGGVDLFPPDEDGRIKGSSRLYSYNSEYRQFQNVPKKRAEIANTEPGFVVALSIFLTHITTSNSSSTTCEVGALTPFHSVCIPPIPIRAYLMRIAQHFCCSNECFVLAIVYVGRIIRLNRGFSLTLLNVHRVILTAIMLATKFFDDVYFSNAFYANISGVGARELNSLEIYFLRLIKFQLFVTEHEYELYKDSIMESVVTNSLVPSLPMSVINMQVSGKSGDQFQVGEFRYFDKRRYAYHSFKGSYPSDPCACGCSSKSCIVNRDSRSEFATRSLNTNKFNSGFGESGYRNGNSIHFQNVSDNTSVCTSRSCVRFTVDMDVNSSTGDYQQESLNVFSTGRPCNQKSNFLCNIEGYGNSVIDCDTGYGHLFSGHKAFLNGRSYFDCQTDCSTASQSEFEEVEQSSNRVQKQFPSGISDYFPYRVSNSLYASNNSSRLSLQCNLDSARAHHIRQFRECSDSSSDSSQFAIDQGSASNIRAVGQSDSGNISELLMFPMSNNYDTIQTTVSVINPTVGNYKQQLLVNSSFRCSTGFDRKLFV